VVARGIEAAESLAAELRDGGADAIAVAADCVDPAEVEDARLAVERALGSVELLVPFAGGFGSFTTVAEMALSEYHEVVAANLTSTFVTVQAFLPGMIERGAGSIVTMSSISARFLDRPTQAVYAAAKAAVTMFTRHLALEVGEHGIRANCIAPGTTRSERIDGFMDAEAIARVGAMSPLGRIGEGLDSAAATLFLLSGSASWLTGVTLDVNGGRVML
jgi:3-oxoacyl-[acyl-carrier protein] reductase